VAGDIDAALEALARACADARERVNQAQPPGARA